ncbi:MAG: glycosyltransferase family 2 protein [Bryobacterales bacterium]|nr:glycosyltransferase family 2 protein [Bryobacterales bacterium]
MISIVVPAFNEEDGIAELYRRVAAAAAGWGDDFELIIVDDGSRDRTLALCEEMARGDRRLKVVSLSRNFGHQAAVSAGLFHATGSIVAVLDADLQDPPEELAPFLAKIHEGFDVVYAVRTKRKEGVFKRFAYYLYYRLLNRLATLDIPLDSGDFCVMRGEVVQAINALPERNRFVRGLRTWVGFRQTGMTYERQARFAGEPKYTFQKLLKLAADGIVNFSYRPLQWIMLIGLTVGLVSVLLAVVVLVLYITNWTIYGFNPHQARGWTSLILVLLFSSATQLFCLGILGEYIGRLFEEIKRRPVYLVKQRINVEAPEDR